METPLRRDTSPDGVLTLELFEGDDYYLGFQNCPWHTHGDLLAPEYGATPREAAEAFFDSIVADEQVVCISDRVGHPRDIYVTDDPAAQHKYVEPDEKFQMRYWSGKPYADESI